MTTNPSWINTGAEILTGVRYDAWGCDAFSMLDKYIAIRKAHMGGINALGVTWNSEKYDLPAGEYQRQYELEKDIDMDVIRTDANKILQAGKDQEALEELRTKAMENLKSHWNDSVTEVAHTNFDENKKVVITNVDAAKANAQAILQVADSIQKLLKDKQDKTKTALTGLFDAIKQADADFEKKCESAAKNTQGGYDAESAEWMVTIQPNDRKAKVLTDLIGNMNDARQIAQDSGMETSWKERIRKIYIDGGPPTQYQWDFSWAKDEYLSGDELSHLKSTAAKKLIDAGQSRKYYVENHGASEYQIWQRKDVVTDQNFVQGHINDACQALLQLNYDTKNAISQQYNAMAGFLDNINTAPPQTPGGGDPTTGSQTPGGGTGSDVGAGGSSGGASGAGAGGGARGLSSGETPAAADLASTSGDSLGSGSGASSGAGSGAGGGDASGALGSIGQALGSVGQSLGQAMSGFGSALGGGLQGLMGSLGQIIQSAQQAAQEAQQDQKDEQDKDEKDEDKKLKDGDGGRDGEGQDSAEGEDAQDDKADEPAKGEQPHATTLSSGAGPDSNSHPIAAQAGPSTATAPAGMGRAGAPAASADGGVHKQGNNNHGDFEVQANVQQVGPNTGNQGHITGFE